jgi:hypothetical protein
MGDLVWWEKMWVPESIVDLAEDGPDRPIKFSPGESWIEAFGRIVQYLILALFLGHRDLLGVLIEILIGNRFIVLKSLFHGEKDADLGAMMGQERLGMQCRRK